MVTGPLLRLAGKSSLHTIDQAIVTWLFEQRPRAFSANEIADAVPSTLARDGYTSQLSRIYRIHPLIQRRKRRTAKYIPFEYWYGVPPAQSRKRGHP